MSSNSWFEFTECLASMLCFTHPVVWRSGFRESNRQGVDKLGIESPAPQAPDSM